MTSPAGLLTSSSGVVASGNAASEVPLPVAALDPAASAAARIAVARRRRQKNPALREYTKRRRKKKGFSRIKRQNSGMFGNGLSNKQLAFEARKHQ